MNYRRLFFIFLGGWLTLIGLYFYRGYQWQKTIAVLQAENDSLKMELLKGDPDCSEWIEKIVVRGLAWNPPYEIKDRAVKFPLQYDVLVYTRQWPPDTLLHKPMKRRENE